MYQQLRLMKTTLETIDFSVPSRNTKDFTNHYSLISCENRSKHDDM